MIDAIKSSTTHKTTTRKSLSNYEHALASFALCMHAQQQFFKPKALLFIWKTCS